MRTGLDPTSPSTGSWSSAVADTSDWPLVKSADGMDAETFLKHINARHVPIGKLKRVGPSNVPGDENEDTLRAYHKALHEQGDDGFTSIYSNETPINHHHKR